MKFLIATISLLVLSSWRTVTIETTRSTHIIHPLPIILYKAKDRDEFCSSRVALIRSNRLEGSPHPSMTTRVHQASWYPFNEHFHSTEWETYESEQLVSRRSYVSRNKGTVVNATPCVTKSYKLCAGLIHDLNPILAVTGRHVATNEPAKKDAVVIESCYQHGTRKRARQNTSSMREFDQVSLLECLNKICPIRVWG